MCENLDYVNMMTYDFSGSWNTNAPFHNAPLYQSTTDNVMREMSGTNKDFTAPPSAAIEDYERFSIDQAIDQFIAAGCDKKKLIMGTGFYGRSWKKSQGLLKPTGDAMSAGCGTWIYNNEGYGSMEYTDIKHRYDPTVSTQAKADGWQKYHDDVSKAAWLFNPDVEGGLYVSYDDPWSMGEKIKYMKEKGLGGAMIWELSGDREEELLDVIIDGMCPARRMDGFLAPRN
jgi:chitinase